MQFNKFTFDNFRVYTDQSTIDLTSGLNLILADNGKGKSTMLMAVDLLILDKNNSKNLDALVNWNNPEKGFFVEIDFDHDNVNYVTSFKYYKKGKTGTTERVLYKDDELVAEGSANVSNYFKELFDVNLVSNALFCKQNSNDIISITDSERSEILKKMKDIDFSKKVKTDIEPIIEKLSLESTNIDIEIRALEAKAYESTPEHEIEHTKEEINAKVKLVDGYIKTQASLSNDIKKVEELTTKKASVEDDIYLTENNLKNKEATLVSKKEQIAKIDRGEGTNKILEEIKEAKDKIENYPKIDDQIAEIEKASEVEINGLYAQRDAKEKELENYPVKRIMEFDTTELQAKNNELIEIKVELNSANNKLDLAKKGECPECGTHFESTDISKHEKEVAEIQFSMDKVRKDIEVIEAERKIKDEKTKTNALNREKKAEINGVVTNLTEKVKSAITAKQDKISSLRENHESNLKHLNQHKDTLMTKLKDADKVEADIKKGLEEDIASIDKDIEQYAKELALKRTEYIAIKKEIASSDVESLVKRLDILKSDIEDAQNIIDTYNSLVAKNEEIKKANDKLIVDEEADKKVIEGHKAKKDSVNDKIISYQEAKQILLKELPAYIISQSIQTIEDDINGFIDSVYDRSLNIKFKLNKNSIGMTYGGKDNQVPVKGGLSGAEAQLVQIGFVASFNKGINLNTIMLDEPSSAMSENRSEQFFEILGEITNEFKQICVITHSKKMIEYLDNNYNANIITL